MEFKLRTKFLSSKLFKVIPKLIRISFINPEQYINKSNLFMKLLIYWLYAAIVSGIWFFWRYRIYENEFLREPQKDIVTINETRIDIKSLKNDVFFVFDKKCKKYGPFSLKRHLLR